MESITPDTPVTSKRTAPPSGEAATQSAVKAALYFLVVIAAAVMRLVGLGHVPLAPLEASEALAVWNALQSGLAGGAEIAMGSPAYFGLTSLLMPFLGASDTVARLVPALFGIGIVLLPWFLRARLGYWGATTTAALLAVSPLLAAVSRTAGGTSIAFFAVMLVLVAAFRLLEEGQERWLYVLTAALALGLASAPLFYSGIITLLVAWMLTTRVSALPLILAPLPTSSLRQALVLGGVLLVLLSTRFLTFPGGIGSVAAVAGAWLQQFNLTGELPTLLSPLMVVGRYEGILLGLVVAAMFWAVWRNHGPGTLFGYWLLAGLVIILLQRGVYANVLILPAAAYPLVGLVTERILRRGPGRWSLAVAGMVTLLGIAMIAQITRFLRVPPESQAYNLWIMFLAVATLLFIIYSFWNTGAEALVQGLWLAALAFLLVFQWGTAWQLGHGGANDPRERWVQEATDDDVPLLRRTLQQIARSTGNSDNGLLLASAVDTPVLRWYLRDFRRAEIGETIVPGATHAVIIGRGDVPNLAAGSDYLGSDFGLLRRESEQPLQSATPLLDTLRWWLFHESAAGFAEERIILWVRADLVEGK